MTQSVRAKLFMSGESQAVCIPTQFRFDSDEVFIRRDPSTGDLILTRSPSSLQGILEALDALGVPEDFLSPETRLQLPVQERSEL